MQIGPYLLSNNVLLAPMAGITDQPFRQLCTQFGAALTVSEMVVSHAHLQRHPRTLKKTDFNGGGLRAVQILGADPRQMAEAAILNQQRGAQIIDINMGCPAKKVCSVAAGSALLKNERLVADILKSVVAAVEIPVTLKIRTGWDTQNRNALIIARIAEDSGIQALTIHGRSRACKFSGHAEYETIKAVKETVKIPIIANGDIGNAAKARFVLEYTGADAVMIGRAARGKPWIFAEISSMLAGKEYLPPSLSEIKILLGRHLDNLYSFYGKSSGVKIARKHIGWYFDQIGALPSALKSAINQAHQPETQLILVNTSFDLISLTSRINGN
ncbi:MAG: tRNA dihydrouridine synthase DusB [Methylomonas sp.]|jgi:tRNA-dihydrouridine synthase B